ncbi:alpha/beta hydrolase [Streptomyces sp. NPDC002537]
MNNLREDLASGDEADRSNAERVWESLETIAHSGHEATLWAYNPQAFSHFGRAAVAVGDLETADFVAVVVPGMTYSVKKLPKVAKAARNLHQECLRNHPGARVAVLAWMGYHAPAGKDSAKVATWTLAQAGARQLRRDVGELRRGWRESPTRHRQGLPAEPRLTLSGHSYGSATTGLAASLEQGGLADAVILLGSPGASVRHAEALNIGSSNVFVGASNRDPVTYIQAFGTDPAHRSFGGIRFRADHKIAPGQNMMAEHQHYYDTDSESLQNISRVVMGRTHDVARQNGRTHLELSLSPWASKRVRPAA